MWLWLLILMLMFLLILLLMLLLLIFLLLFFIDIVVAVDIILLLLLFLLILLLMLLFLLIRWIWRKYCVLLWWGNPFEFLSRFSTKKSFQKKKVFFFQKKNLNRWFWVRSCETFWAIIRRKQDLETILFKIFHFKTKIYYY